MKSPFCLFWLAFSFISIGCSNVSPDAVDLKVDFSWQGMAACGWGNPEISIEGVPENTKALMVSMYDHAYFHDHGEVTIPYDGTSIIKMGVLEKIQGPCPFGVPGRYKITVKALDGDDIIIGTGSKERYFPEEK